MPIIPPAAPAGVLRYEWIDPGGTVRDLSQATSPGLFVGRGSVGLGSASAEIGSDKVPRDPGALVRHLATPARRIELPIVIIEDSISDLLTVVDALRTWFDTGNERRLAPGTLRITRPDNTVRQIKAYYAGGLEGDTGEGTPAVAQYVVSLFCPDPFPTEDTDTTQHYASDTIGVQQIIINQGDLEAYPIWTVTGPAFGIGIVRNTPTPSEFWALIGGAGLTLAAGETVTVDTRPSHIRTNLPVLDGSGASRYDRVLPTSSFFHFEPGENRFTVSLFGSTGDTAIDLSYLARYRGLLR